MNIAKILNKIFSSENLNCDLCWNFVFAGRQDHFNLNSAETDCESCCVRVGVISNTFTTGYQGNDNFTRPAYRDWSFQIFAGIPSELDIQFYNEISNDPDKVKESKWEKYLYPVFCCLADIDQKICDIYNCDCEETTLEMRSWDFEQKLNFLDANYDGWLIRARFREWIR